MDEEIKQPVALQCTDCTTMSAYDLRYNDEMPRGWREDDTGYHCNNCRKGKK